MQFFSSSRNISIPRANLTMPAWLHWRRQDIQKIKKTSFLSLPTEIYLEILEYLDVPSEICLRLACRHLYFALPTIPKVNLYGVKSDISDQVHGRKTCLKCNKVYISAAFPQLVDTPPDLQRTPDVSTWLTNTIYATRNITRIGCRKAMMKIHGLVHASPAPNQLPEASAWADNSSKRLKWSTTHGEYVKCRLPRGGWVHIHRNHGSAHLFEYRGFCGWVYQGWPFFRNGQKWIFHCECLRCSPTFGDANKICCLCDPNDSRHILTNPTAHERGFPDRWGPGRICLEETKYPYGKETLWVGRRRNTCMRGLNHLAFIHRSRIPDTDPWEPEDRPSWSWSWCGVCSPYYTPGPNSRKKKDHEGWNDPALWGLDQCRRICSPHRLNPQRKLIMKEIKHTTY